MQRSGYAIVRRAEHDLEDYMRSPTTQQNLHYLQALRDAAPFLVPSDYRGTGRFWLQPFPSLDAGIIKAFAETGGDMSTEASARRRFREVIGETESSPDFDEDLLESEAQAREVFSLLQDGGGFELLHLHRREFACVAGVLGYDIGYWGGDHYSLISDSFVAPRWHPPPPEIFQTLAEQLRCLNDCLLFPSSEAAGSFRSWYRTQDWAETEGREDEFEIIQVCAVEVA
jgi:hypothetical protein